MDISFIGWIHTLIALIAIFSGAYSLKKYTIIETKNLSAKIFIITTIIAAITALLIYKRGFGVGHLLAIITLLAVIFGYINEKGLFFGFLAPYFQIISYSALFFQPYNLICCDYQIRDKKCYVKAYKYWMIYI